MEQHHSCVLMGLGVCCSQAALVMCSDSEEA